MFAMVIADTRQGVVHLIRDRVGVKPLYWGQWGTAVLWASEAKAFLAHPSFRAAIDSAALDELLAFRSVAGERTLLAGVRQVPPGHVISITPNRTVTRRYWSIPDNTGTLRVSLDEASDRLAQLLDRSAGAQLRADVKVGCQLSGGLDSSIVTTLAAAHQPGLEAFSIVCDEPRFSEERWIDAVTETTGVVSHRFVFGATEFVDAMDRASWHFDQPIGHPNSLALWALARRAREHATVLLTGEGADELFGGYARIHTCAAMSADAFVRATQFHPQSRLARLRPDSDLRPAIERRRSVFDEGQGDHFSNCLRYDMRTHLADVLMRQDRMMMAHGIENRVPFLDREVIEFARALPAEHLVGAAGRNGAPRGKNVVKHLALRRFDAAFVERRKSGFNLPLAQYFRSPAFVSVMEDRLLPGMASRGLVDVDVVRRWWRRALSAPSTTEGFWIVVAVEAWAQQFLDGRHARGDHDVAAMARAT
jgi:asparagine synthase (glutamine-hydrolysing)